MLGFSPLASSPIADNGAGLKPSWIVTGAPVVPQEPFIQIHGLTAPDTTLGQPTLTSSDIEIVAVELVHDNILTGSPVVEAAVLTENVVLTIENITTGTPEVSSTQCLVTFNAVSIETGSPELTSTDIVLVRTLEPASILSGVPYVGGTAFQFVQQHVLVGTRIGFDTVDISTSDLTEAETIQANKITCRHPEVISGVFNQQKTFELTSIVANSPSVPSVLMYEGENLIPLDIIVSGAVEIDTSDFVQGYPLDGESIITTPAVSVPSITMVETEIFSGVSILTGSPVLKGAYLGGSGRRVVDVDEDTSNIVTFSYEYNIAV